MANKKLNKKVKTITRFAVLCETDDGSFIWNKTYKNQDEALQAVRKELEYIDEVFKHDAEERKCDYTVEEVEVEV